MPTRLKIKSILERHSVSIYALQKKTEEQGRRISYQALHALVNNPEPHSIRLNTLDAVLLALRDLTNEKLTICDLLEYER
jgi:hypothetical protein